MFRSGHPLLFSEQLRRPCRVVLILALVLGLSAAVPQATTVATAQDGQHGRWVGTWMMAPSGPVDNGCRDCTIRDVVHTSVGGDQVRIRLSNTFGSAPLSVAHTTAALPSVPSTAQVAAGSLREVTFSGARSVVVAQGSEIWSDPIRLRVPADHDLLVTTYTPGYATPMTYHPDAQQASFFTRGQDNADATSAASFPETTQAWHLLTGVDVAGSTARGTVVAFGDSITDGFQSTSNVDHRWPNFLAGRLLAERAGKLGVLDAGIGGNRILLDGGAGFGPPALDRLDRDVLQQSDARDVIVLLGINDIQQTPHQLDPAQIIAGLRQIADRSHRAGLRVVGGTITPFEGWSTYDAQEEATRQAVNAWIRTSHAYDAVADFDATLHDPADPHRMRPVYDSGDHLHPNDLGYAAMADAVDLGRL